MQTLFIIFLMLFSCQSLSQAQEFILHNGLKVIVKEDKRAPIATFMIWYNVGAADESGGHTGLSHVIEHMMFKGSQQFPKGVFSKTIASIGGQENAFTSNDYTAFFEKVAAPHLKTCFMLEADRMTKLNLDAEEFAKEIKVIQEERRLRTDNNPQALAFERFLATAHLALAYNHPVIGWMSDLKNMSVLDVKEWYQRYYAPNNAVIVVVGDVQPDEVKSLAEQYFGSIESKPIPKRPLQKEPPSLGAKSIMIHGPAQLPMYLVGYMVPSVPSAKVAYEPYALELIAGILDAGESARLTKDLIRKNHVVSSAQTYYNIYSRYQTQFIVFGTPNQNHSIPDLRKAFLAEIEQLKTKPIPKDELQRVKNQIIAQKTYEKDSIFGQAMELGLLETVGIGWQKAANYNEHIQEVTAEQIMQTAKRYFTDNNSTQAELQP